MVRSAIYYFSHFSFLSVALSRWKSTKLKISIKFHLKNGKTFFESLISPSFDELYYSPIVYMNRMEPMFQDLPFCCTKKVPKNHNNFFHFRHVGGTHFLVVAQTLIYPFRILHSWKLQYTVGHKLLCSLIENRQSKLIMFFCGPMEIPGASLLYNNNTDWTGE